MNTILRTSCVLLCLIATALAADTPPAAPSPKKPPAVEKPAPAPEKPAPAAEKPADKPPAEPPAKPEASEKRIQELIKQLGDKDYFVRQRRRTN